MCDLFVYVQGVFKEWHSNSRSKGGYKPSFSSQQLGLTRPNRSNDYNSQLDNQVVFTDVPVGPLSLKLVESILSKESVECELQSHFSDYNYEFNNSNDDVLSDKDDG